MSKGILGVIAIVVVAGLGWYAFSQRTPQPSGNDSRDAATEETTNMSPQQSVPADTAIKDPKTGSVRNSEERSVGNVVGGVREFSMDSYYDMESQKAVFTVGEMVVKKGDKVRVNVRNTFGKHDFTIDEFDVSVETPQDQTTAVEFTASQAGEFIYYCSKPNHRGLGQWGVLRVTE